MNLKRSNIITSPAGLFIIILASVFISEIFVMIILKRLNSLTFLQITLIDATLIFSFTFSISYWFLFKPLVSQISKRELAETILKKSEERYRNIFQNVQDVYYEVTLDGIIIELSPSISTMSGGQYTRKDLLGSSVYDLYADPAEREILLAVLYKEGAVRDYEISLKNKDGSLFNCAISSRLSFDIHNVPRKITGSIRDISVRKRAEEDIRRMNEQLRSINSEKDKLFSIIAHDLRSPLSSFIGLTGIMAQDGHKLIPAEHKKFSDSMHKSATNLYGLLENLLLWSGTKQGTLGFTLQTINLRQIVIESISSLVTTAEEKSIAIVCRIAYDIEVEADINSLQTIIRNLISNAIKFTMQGGKIIITSEPVKGKTQISVTDTGIGMDTDMISRLFTIDGKINRQGTGGEPSTGLGLLLCHELIEKHGGRITVESEVNKGSTFRFTI